MWHYFSAWDAIILAQIHKKFPSGLKTVRVCGQILTKLLFIWAFCSTGDLGNVEMSFFYLLCDQPLVFIMSGAGLVYIFYPFKANLYLFNWP